MFTGLVTGVGTVTKVSELSDGRKITIAVPGNYRALELGESIAGSGVCMTVAHFEVKEPDAWFECTAGHETLAITSLGFLKEGSTVNLERAMGLGQRMGGHLVSGHVDAISKVIRFEEVGVGWDLDIEVGPELRHYFILKGSVAIDGVSLTVARLDDQSLGIMLIPHTLEVTTLGTLQAGDFVNIEVDMIGKYVARMLGSAGLIDAPQAPLEDLLSASAPMKDDEQ